MPAQSWRAIATSEDRVNSDRRDAVALAEFLRADEFTASPVKIMRRSGLRSVPALAQSAFNASPPASRQVHAQVRACPSSLEEVDNALSAVGAGIEPNHPMRGEGQASRCGDRGAGVRRCRLPRSFPITKSAVRWRQRISSSAGTAPASVDTEKSTFFGAALALNFSGPSSADRCPIRCRLCLGQCSRHNTGRLATPSGPLDRSAALGFAMSSCSASWISDYRLVR
jgi:hypothetical protein